MFHIIVIRQPFLVNQYKTDILDETVYEKIVNLSAICVNKYTYESPHIPLHNWRMFCKIRQFVNFGKFFYVLNTKNKCSLTFYVSYFMLCIVQKLPKNKFKILKLKTPLVLLLNFSTELKKKQEIFLQDESWLDVCRYYMVLCFAGKIYAR